MLPYPCFILLVPFLSDAQADATVTNMTSFSMDFKNDLVAVTEKNPAYTSES